MLVPVTSDHIDWIRLWLLNRTVYMRCQTSWLTHDVERDGWGYWSFPSRPAIQAGVDARIVALRQCIEQDLIRIYSDSWLKDSRFREQGALEIGRCWLEDEQFVENSEAVTTPKGHELWESQFQPEWLRYWQLSYSSEDPTTNEVTFFVKYASNLIFDELVEWLPSFLGLDENFGMQEEGCHTYFGYQATKWKILPYVKVITWRGLCKDQLFAEILQSAQNLADEVERSGLQQRAGQHFVKVGEKQKQAIQVLTRLSRKWDCQWQPNTERNDSMPVLLVDDSQ